MYEVECCYVFGDGIEELQGIVWIGCIIVGFVVGEIDDVVVMMIDCDGSVQIVVDCKIGCKCLLYVFEGWID